MNPEPRRRQRLFPARSPRPHTPPDAPPGASLDAYERLQRYEHTAMPSSTIFSWPIGGGNRAAPTLPLAPSQVYTASVMSFLRRLA